MNDINTYLYKYNDIENQISNENINNQDLLNNLKNDIDDINKYKDLVNKSKSLMIKINKSSNIIMNKKKIEKKINKYIHLLDNQNISYLKLIQNIYNPFLNIDYDKLNNKIENIIINISDFQFLDFYSIINSKKLNKNNLHKIISYISKNNNLNIPKIMFLSYNDILETKNSIISFLNKFNFNYINKKNKTLKRGFIFQMKNDNKHFIVKYQPNKSFIEIIINKYLSKFNQFKNYILFPKYIFINKNNSYFYIIEKYDCDLLKFLKITPFIHSNTIIKIIQFISNCIYFMHNIGIIYGDIKLENIVVNYDNNYNIIDMKLIDFDVSLFNNIPKELNKIDEKILNLLQNKKPRGTKIYMSKNEFMENSNDIYSIGVFIIILFYKNILKVFNENNNIVSQHLKSKIIKKLDSLKNNIEKDQSKINLMKYIFRIYNDKRFKHFWNHQIPVKNIYYIVKNCIYQNIDSKQLYHELYSF